MVTVPSMPDSPDGDGVSRAAVAASRWRVIDAVPRVAYRAPVSRCGLTWRAPSAAASASAMASPPRMPTRRERATKCDDHDANRRIGRSSCKSMTREAGERSRGAQVRRFRFSRFHRPRYTAESSGTSGRSRYVQDRLLRRPSRIRRRAKTWSWRAGCTGAATTAGSSSSTCATAAAWCRSSSRRRKRRRTPSRARRAASTCCASRGKVQRRRAGTENAEDADRRDRGARDGGRDPERGEDAAVLHQRGVGRRRAAAAEAPLPRPAPRADAQQHGDPARRS